MIIERLWRRPALLLKMSAALLCLGGWVLIFSASGVLAEEKMGSATYFLQRQIAWTFVGLVGLIVASHIPIFILRKAGWLVAAACAVFLLTVYIPGVGNVKNGARRWIHIGGNSLQPSEFVKIGVILYLARYLSEKQKRLLDFRRGLIPPLIVLGVLCGLILLEPDFGSAVLLGTVGIVMLYLGGIRLLHLGALSLLGLPVIIFLAWGAEYRRDRLMSFMRPWDDPMGKGFNIIQSLIALGSGGWDGVGIGGSVQKLYFLPYPYSDFIFSIAGEETGFLGGLFLISLYALFVLAGYSIARRCPDTFGRLLAAGVVSMIGLQAAIHVGVVSGMFPTKGLPLPFVSFGGSSLVATMAGVGLILNVAKQESTVVHRMSG